MLLPGTASQALGAASVYTTSAHTGGVKTFTPKGLAVDTYGDIFVADSANSTVDIDCLSTTAAAAQPSSANPNSGIFCQANAGYAFELGTSFVSPIAVALDGANAVYVLDSSTSGNPVTKLYSSTMTSSVLIPNGATISGTAFSNPQGITLDGYGNIYIADTGNNRIVQAHQFNAPNSQNVVYVPSTTTFGGTKLSAPIGLAVDSVGDLFIADSGNNRIVEFSVTGVASVVSITGITLKTPTDVAVLPSGALIVSDTNNLVSLVDAGIGTKLTFSTSLGSALTPGTPSGVALDLSGNIYVADPSNSQIEELNVNTPATMTTFPSTKVGANSADIDFFVYNAGTAPLNFTVAPSLASTVNFTIDSSATTCTTTTAVSAGSNCVLAAYFQPQAVGVLSTTATWTDNQPVVSGTASATFGYKGTFASSSSQTAALSSTFTPQTITFANPGTQTVGTPLTLVATTTAPALTVSFASSTTSVCTVSGTTATFLISGTCTIVASQAGNSVYGPTSVSQTITVNGTPQTITFTDPGPQLYVSGLTVSLSASTTATGLTVSFASGTTSVCTVSGTVASILTTGTCTITASQAGTTVYAAATPVPLNISVNDPLPVLSSLSTTNVSWGAPTFTLTINGSAFVPSSTVYWDTAAMATTYVSPTQLTAVVHVFETDYAGVHAITVQSPTPGGGTSNSMQFEVDSEYSAATPPNFTTTTATVTAGSSASYPVTLPSTATNISATCLNLPTGATCSYASNTVTIATLASTPKGTYQIAVVFTETLPGSVTISAFVLFPFLLTPIVLVRRRLASKGLMLTVCLVIALSAGVSILTGCGGASMTSTHQVTSSSAVTLTVK
jgi:sugar lactone lactonase YvrE